MVLDNPYGAPHIGYVAVQQMPRMRCVNLGRYSMAESVKTAGAGAAEGLETAMKNGTEAFKAGFEKVVKNYDQVVGYNKDTVEACTKAASAAGKGAETLHNELYSYSKQSVEGSLAAAKALLGTKSVQEALELQSVFAKSAFDAYVTEVTKLSEIFLSTAKDTFEPLQGRAQAWMDIVQSSRAA
jgi:phasin family protein